MTNRRKFQVAVTAVLLLCAATAFAEQSGEWISTLTNPEIQFRTQVFFNMQACYLEFRDQKQGPRETTFDAQVDYKSPEVGPDGQPTMKTETEHVVTTPTHKGTARIANCVGVLAARVSQVERQ